MIKVGLDERLGIGLIAFIDPSSPTPVLPLVTYYRRIKPRLELDLIFPSKIALRKQFENESWLSLLTEFNANVLFSSNASPYIGNFQTNIVNLRSGFGYERQVHRMLFVGVKGGIQADINTRQQKIYASRNDLVAKIQRKLSPFLSINVALVPTKFKR
ncbi:hypothetical protein [Dyadobacter sp. 32]|uniref:hypothetical protein n=1 Tax=Dyadobacter sp. 32 TaxID=538966 RepID=UPI0011F08F7D